MRAAIELEPVRNSIANSNSNTLSQSDLQDLENQIQIYLTPTQEKFTINFSLLCNYESLSIKIVDITGREMWRMRKQFVTSQEIDLSIYTNGVYLLLLNLDSQQVVKRVILQ